MELQMKKGVTVLVSPEDHDFIKRWKWQIEKRSQGHHTVVVKRPGSALSDEDVIDYAREHLASYKIPRSVSFLDEIPRTGSGKILKRVLREPYWRDSDRQV